MFNRGLTLTLLLALCAVFSAWWWQNRSLTNAERLLVQKLDQSISSNPPQASDIVDAFSLPEECQEKTCWLEEGSIDDLRYSDGNLRPQDHGLIFQIEEFSNACIRAQRMEAYYDLKEPESNCSHGSCWYRKAQFSWGILTFGVKEPGSRCVSSVVINTLPYQRPYTSPPTVFEVEGQSVCIEHCEH